MTLQPATFQPAVASSSSPPASSYTPPTALEDLHILDFLELAGSQAKAPGASGGRKPSGGVGFSG